MSHSADVSECGLLNGIAPAVAPRAALEKVLERLDREAQLVNVEKAIFTRLNAEASSYPRSRAAHPFQIITGNAVNLVAMGVARLWDDTAGAQSIPNAMHAGAQSRLPGPSVVRRVVVWGTAVGCELPFHIER